MSGDQLASLEMPRGFWVSQREKIVLLGWVQCRQGFKESMVGCSSVVEKTGTNAPETCVRILPDVPLRARSSLVENHDSEGLLVSSTPCPKLNDSLMGRYFPLQ